MEKPEEILKNRIVLDLEKNDELGYIYLLFLIYSVKQTFPELRHLSLFQFNSKYKSLKNRSESLVSAYNYVQTAVRNKSVILATIDEGYSVEQEVLKKHIISKIYELFKNTDVFDEDIEKLELQFVSHNLGNVLIYSPTVRSYFFENLESLKSIKFNFFSSLTDTLFELFLELNGVPHERVHIDFEANQDEERFDNIILFPPYRNQSLMNKILNAEAGTQAQSVEWTIISKLLECMSKDGHIVSYIQTGALNKVSDAKTRKGIVQDGYIESVVELPRISYLPFPISLVSFSSSNNKIKLINSSKFAQNIRRGINLDSDKIIRALTGQIEGAILELDNDEFERNDYDLTPKRFFDEPPTDFINPTPLSEVSRAIYRGFQIPSEMLDEYESTTNTKIKLLTLSSIDDGQIVKSEITSLKGIDKKMEHYIIEDDDLVISCKGKTFKTAVIHIPYGETYISTGSLIVIRCDKEKIDPTYLKIFLDSDLGTTQLRRIQTGTTVLSLNPSKLHGIIVPLPSLSKQLLISSSYKYKKANLKEVKDVVSQMEEEIDKKFNRNFLAQLQ